MHEELISKKDLLSLTNISYGQLYRWKRKNLIPEEWFIKKSVTTGQETFFPREKILERVNTILDLKDDASLDELADKFTNNIKNISLLRGYIMERNIVSDFIVNRYEEFMGSIESYDESNLFALLIFKELLLCGVLSQDECKKIAISAKENFSKVEGVEYKLWVKRKLGVCFYFVTKESEEVFCDEDSIVLVIIDLGKLKNDIKVYGQI